MTADRWRHRIYRRRPMPSPVLFSQAEIVARIDAFRRSLPPDRCPTCGSRIDVAPALRARRAQFRALRGCPW